MENYAKIRKAIDLIQSSDVFEIEGNKIHRYVDFEMENLKSGNVKIDLDDPASDDIVLAWEWEEAHNDGFDGEVSTGEQYRVALTIQGLIDAVIVGNSITTHDENGDEVKIECFKLVPNVQP
jgi:hypothetical protein